MARLVTVILLFCGAIVATAQINESDTLKWQHRVSLSGNYQTGNVKYTAIRSRLDISWMPLRNWVFKTQNSSLYQAFRVKADNDVFSRNFLYFQPQKKVYPFAMAFVSTNFRRKIDLRWFAGAGATGQLVSRQAHSLKLSASTVYESSRFLGSDFNLPEYDGDEVQQLWRGTFYLAGWHRLLDKRLRLFYDAYWQPAFSDAQNYRSQLDVGLDLSLHKGLSFNVLYSYSFENLVVKNVKQEDSILTFGLAWQLKK